MRCVRWQTIVHYSTALKDESGATSQTINFIISDTITPDLVEFRIENDDAHEETAEGGGGAQTDTGDDDETIAWQQMLCTQDKCFISIAVAVSTIQFTEWDRTSSKYHLSGAQANGLRQLQQTTRNGVNETQAAMSTQCEWV